MTKQILYLLNINGYFGNRLFARLAKKTRQFLLLDSESNRRSHDSTLTRNF